MGSFDYTCGISGLPISAGDAVRYMLVTQNPYHRGKTASDMTCGMEDVWFPRTFPLRGTYNDYGGVDGLQGTAQQAAWVAGFKVDLIQKGWGDNACHDVPAKKDMTLSKLLTAVREGRVHVRHDVGDRDTEKEGKLFRALRLKEGKPLVALGIPTRLRVEQALVEAGYKISESYHNGVIVNRVDANTVRVRFGPYEGRAAELTKIRDLLADRYAGMVRSGTGTSGDDAELILCPLPGVRCRTKRDRTPGLCVASMMIREDVWQAICALPLATYRGEWGVTANLQAVQMLWAKSLDAGDMRRFMMARDSMVATDSIPFTVGLGTHWHTMVDLWEAGAVTEAERDDFLRTAAEFELVARWLGMTRYQWRPSGVSGPQCGEYGLHAALLSTFATIAVAIHQTRSREDADDA